MVDTVDPRVAKLKTVVDCERFARNAKSLGRSDLADEARRRAIDLRADEYGTGSDVEKECIRAVYAYEEVIARRSGKRHRANRTWQMIKRRGILEAAERAVDREVDASGYRSLAEMGLADLSFEAVIVRNPSHFSQASVDRARARLRDWQEG